jgi:membrane associated rhomboid family serine protease
MSLFALFHSAVRPKCYEFNLVLQAVDLESQVVYHENRYYLLVDEQVAERAYRQLKRYVDENTPEETITKPLIPASKGFIGAYLYGIILLLFGVLQSSSAFDIDWQQTGLADSWKIIEGDWWRTITALTLHADIAHLAGNIGFGALFGILVSQYIGAAAAWFTILLSGATGNLVNAYLYKSLHLSLGASTMVFAALGILGIFALENKASYRRRSLRRWLPFLATVALLAFTGTAGERTDVLAHLSGFFCGCASGLVWVAFSRPQFTQRNQQLMITAISLLILTGAWMLALTYP